MTKQPLITQVKLFWNNQSLFGKHLLTMLGCFLGLPLIIVTAKLGFRESATALMLLEGVVLFWAMGFWYAVKGAWRLFNTVI